MVRDCVSRRSSRNRKRSGGGVRMCDEECCVVCDVQCGPAIGLCGDDVFGV